MHPSASRTLFRFGALLGAGPLAGCTGAPSVPAAGAYFPAWLVCALAAVLAAILTRAVFVATGLAQTLPLQLGVCLAIGALAGVLVWAAWVGA